MMAGRVGADRASGADQTFGARTNWPAGLAVAAAVAILLGSAALATAVSWLVSSAAVLETTPRTGIALDKVRAGLVWLLAFQFAIVGQTLAAARLRGGVPRLVLSLGWPDAAARQIVCAVTGLGLFAALFAALVFAVDRAALVQDLAPAAALARSDVWLVALAAIGIGAPLSEELLFRGFLFPALANSRLGLGGAAITSTLAWTALHAGYSIYGLVEVFLVGLFFCWLAVRSGSLWVSILCHAIYNTAIVLGLRWLPIPL